MARGYPFQTSFNGGEISPRLKGRVDIDKYGTSVELMENFIPMVYGAAVRRSGTRYVGEVIDSTKEGRLIPFIFSDQQAYVFELSDQKLRIFTLEGRLLPGTYNFLPADVTVASPGKIKITDYTYSEDQGPFRFSGTDLPDPLAAGTDYYINRVDDDEFGVSLTSGGASIQINDQGTGTHTITPQSGVYIEIDTPWLEADLAEIQFAQSADIIYLCHQDYAPRKISRIGATKFRLETISFYDGPYETLNQTSITVSSSATALGATTLTASADLFSASDVGRIFRFQDPNGDWGWMTITGFTDAQNVSATIERVISAGTATPKWRLGLWYTGNYPRSVSFHEQRLVFAGAPNNPQRFDGSVIADFENFAPTGGPVRDTAAASFDDLVATDNAYGFTIASNQVNTISWINSIRNLLIGTLGGIWPVQATSNLEIISPDNISVRRSSAKGSASVVPVNVEDATVYLSRTTRRVLEVAYSFEADAFLPVDLTVIAEHITDAEVKQLQYAQDPDSIVWALRSDGVLLSLVRDRQQKVAGWSKHIIGGSFGTGDAVVESIAVIPAISGSVTPEAHNNQKHDQLWLIVKRTINGSTVRYVEFMEDRFPSTESQEDMFFVDGGATYNGAATDTIPDADHLEGETVSLLVDGAAHPDRTVSGGQISLDDEYSVVQYGLPYISLMKTLPLEGAGSRVGSSQGKLKRVDNILARLDRTIGLEIGIDEDGTEFDPVLFRTASDLMGSPVPFFSGDKIIPIETGWNLFGHIYIRQTYPMAATILAIGFWTETTERGSE